MTDNLEPTQNRGPVPSTVRPVQPIRAWLAAAGYLVVIALLAIRPQLCANVLSRYATAESLVNRGTLAIEKSPLFEASKSDVAKFGAHFYSDKPPVLSAMAAVVLELLGLGGVQIAETSADFAVSNWLLVVCIVGVSSAACLVSFRKLLHTIDLSGWKADMVTLTLGFATLLLPYSVTFNNHVVAASSMTTAFWLVGSGFHGVGQPVRPEAHRTARR